MTLHRCGSRAYPAEALTLDAKAIAWPVHLPMTITAGIVETSGRPGSWLEESMTPHLPIHASGVPSLSGSPYPEPFASFASSSGFRKIADQFGLTQFGVNLVTLDPGAQSGLRHWHTLEDELIYVLEGEIILQLDDGEHVLSRGMCVGFKAGDRNGHLTRNRGTTVAHYLMIGSRVHGDVCFYPDDDLAWLETEAGAVAVHKDGSPYLQQP